MTDLEHSSAQEPDQEDQTSPDRLTRRGLLAGAAVAGAAAALPEAAEARKRHKRKHAKHGQRQGTAPTTGSSLSADVVVVGAGLAGLTAARNVVAAGKSVIVLEARDRVGGRMWNHDLGGGVISERGGTFVGPTQGHLLDLAKALGVGTFDTYDAGNDVFYDGSSVTTYSDTSPLGTAPPDPQTLPDITSTVAQFDQMSTTVPVDAPWTAPNAAVWDQQTLDTWIRANTSNSARFRAVVSVATRAIFGAEPRDLSLLFVLFYIASSGDEKNPGTFERNFDTRGGAQMSRFVGGSQEIPLRMAAQLGSKVMLSQPVRRIVRSGGSAQVSTDTVTVAAKRVVVAIPATLAGRIDYEPILPEARDQFTSRAGQGSLIKVGARYDRAFWRDSGLNGQGVSLTGPVCFTVDDSPPSGTPGVMFGFVGGDAARSFIATAPDARRNQVLSEFAAMFGSQAASPRDYFETNWTAEPWTRGCPVALPSTGTLLEYGPALRAPVDLIHWAGTETSPYWNGYMDGAVRSGERAAREVLAEL
ncbi:MAG TPA: flavin monoamine oxidase family protein [Solirubrobacteraceae bacterium]|nr:flavin monoamine oxidase family protein [Solirubrobacteraceae bacterium]